MILRQAFFLLFTSLFSCLKTYQQPVENLLITLDRNITTLFAELKTIVAYPLF